MKKGAQRLLLIRREPAVCTGPTGRGSEGDTPCHRDTGATQIPKIESSAQGAEPEGATAAPGARRRARPGASDKRPRLNLRF